MAERTYVIIAIPATWAYALVNPIRSHGSYIQGFWLFVGRMAMTMAE